MSDQMDPSPVVPPAVEAPATGRCPHCLLVCSAAPEPPGAQQAGLCRRLWASAAALAQLHAQLHRAQAAQTQVRQTLAQAEQALCSLRAELAAARGRERLALHMAQHDGLTQLPNRMGFSRRVTEALDAARPPDRRQPLGGGTLAVLFLDLDGMKAVNDQHGHGVGDQVLRIVAIRLARSIRSEDMVCRLGGDEFACLLSQPMSQSQLRGLAVKLYESVSAPMQLGRLMLCVRPSIGIAVNTQEAGTVDALLALADTAMYQAKRQRLGHAFHPSVAAALPAV